MALTQEQLEAIGETLVPIFQEFESAVIGDICRRLRKTGRLTETAELMARNLRRKGYSPAAIRAQVMIAMRADAAMQKEIDESTLEQKKLVQQEIDELRKKAGNRADSALEKAADMAFNNDMSAWKGDRLPVKGSAFERLVQAMQQRVGDAIINLTKSAGFRSANGQWIQLQQAYTHSLNIAFTKIATGAYSYGQAMEEAVRELARSGIRVIEFENGAKRQADTVVRNAMLTSSAQLAGQITMMNIEDTGVELVEVSAHWGARTGEGHGNHAAWQGKIYCMRGSDGVHRNLEEATGYPSDPRGLLGYNCRHTFYPYWEGISQPTQWPPEPEPVEINGKTYTHYQATQQQRKMEREIRAKKREAYALRQAGRNKEASEAKAMIKSMTAEYEEFSDAAGISPKPARLRVAVK